MMQTLAERLTLTALNCSIGHSRLIEGLDMAVEYGFGNVEMWWPFATPEPARREMDELIAELDKRALNLVALNMWGGDMSAGDRGILHREDMPKEHLDAIAYFNERTGVDKFNVLLGRGGDHLQAAQAERWSVIAREIAERFGGIAMVEPLSGADDYPIRTIASAESLIRIAGHGGLLLDLYHVAVNTGVWKVIPEGSSEDAAVTAVSTAAVDSDIDNIATANPVHVQVADAPGRGAPGTGRLPLTAWISELRKANYRGHIVGEWLPQ
ncbi:TIM barrel protein [Corynebacterium anserum]|nr:TIM barrel protein [Corynebacterium anserum]MBC2681824.1 endonuclease [Corynebacterium anserum]